MEKIIFRLKRKVFEFADSAYGYFGGICWLLSGIQDSIRAYKIKRRKKNESC